MTLNEKILQEKEVEYIEIDLLIKNVQVMTAAIYEIAN